MKYFEQKDEVERQIMILKAVCGSALIEGMDKAAEECEEEIRRLQEKQRDDLTTTLRSSAQTN
ncbi:MAG: hypothetical protein HQK59_02665 [Deltaproteobacteria bacterium]|nr:hypothetical protein [Deltaproteobacteria bacterium]